MYADNTIQLYATDGNPGDIVSVQVSMSVTDKVVAAEFSFPMVDGLTFVPESFTVEAEELTMSSQAALNKDGLRVFFFSTQLDMSKIGNGPLFSFKVKLGRTPGIFKINPTAILSDENGKALRVNVSTADITVKAPDIALSAEKIDFGHIAIRSSYSKTLGIRNVGTVPLTVASISCTSPELTVSETYFTVQPGSTKQVSLNYSPLLANPDEFILSIISDAIDHECTTLEIVADSYSVNELSVGKSSGDVGTDISLDLLMDNMENISAVQCSFSLPEGVTFVGNSFIPSDRSCGMNLFSSEDNCTLKLYIFSESGNFISEGSGKIATFKLHLESMNGFYDLVPNDVILANKNLTNMISAIHYGSIEVLSPSLACSPMFDMGTISMPDSPTGEYIIRNEGKKDLIIDRISFEGDEFCLNDNCPIVVSPGSQKCLSISCVLEESGEYSAVMTLYTNTPQNRMTDVFVGCRIIEPNYISPEALVNSDGKSGILKVSLSNYNTISAIQFNVYGLENVTFDKSSFTMTDRCSDFSFSISENNDGSTRILLYSIADKCISGNDGELFMMNFTSMSPLKKNQTITISDILISDVSGRNISTADSVSIMAVVTKVGEIVDIAPSVIYNLTGRYVGDDFESLPVGIYIRNGRKFMVK